MREYIGMRLRGNYQSAESSEEKDEGKKKKKRRRFQEESKRDLSRTF